MLAAVGCGAGLDTCPRSRGATRRRRRWSWRQSSFFLTFCGKEGYQCISSNDDQKFHSQDIAKIRTKWHIPSIRTVESRIGLGRLDLVMSCCKVQSGYRPPGDAWTKARKLPSKQPLDQTKVNHSSTSLLSLRTANLPAFSVINPNNLCASRVTDLSLSASPAPHLTMHAM